MILSRREKARSGRKLQGGQARLWYTKSSPGNVEKSGECTVRKWRNLDQVLRLGCKFDESVCYGVRRRVRRRLEGWSRC
jgi:hypothetical protein